MLPGAKFCQIKLDVMRFLIWVVLMLQSLSVFAQNEHYNFFRLDTYTGLSNNQVNAILKDQNGFLWFGTRSGLNRYDGYSYRVFRQNSNDISSLVGNSVQSLYELPDGKMLVLTTEGACIYNSSTEKFDADYNGYLHSLGLPSGMISNVVKGNRGRYWFLYNNLDLYLYSCIDKKLKSLRQNLNVTSLDRISSIKETKDGKLWLVYTEALWVTSKITESYVKFVKQSGFNAVRIPCTWISNHSSNTEKATIDPAWLNRVKEVVGWCVANDMYVILNIHGDGLDKNIDKTHIEAGNAEKMAILNGYYDTFIKAVRSTGGKNSYRVLAVHWPSTDPTKTYDLMNTMPTDNIPNKLIVEVHDYTPSLFTIITDGDQTWGKMIYYWGAGNHSTIEPERNATFGEEGAIDSEFQKMKQKFVDKGIPKLTLIADGIHDKNL